MGQYTKSRVEEYAGRIDPSIRNIVKAISSDMDFAIVAFLLENKEAQFTEMLQQIGVKKNKLTYSLRKLLYSGVIFKRYEKNPAGERSFYWLTEPAIDLVTSTESILESMTQKMSVLYRGPNSGELMEMIFERTAAKLQADPSFVRLLGQLFVTGNNILPRLYINENTGKYLETALTTAVSESSTDIALLAQELGISNHFPLKWVLLNQALGYIAFSEKFAKFSKYIESIYRNVRIAYGMKILEEFDALRKLGTLHKE